MNAVADLQTWLNSRGATPKLVVDGRGGPATRAAVFQVFRNTAAPKAGTAEIQAICDRLGCTLRQMMAVARVESREGWDRAGLLTCLYERHYMWRFYQKKIPLLSDPAAGGYTVDVDHDSINDSWEKVADAACIVGAKAFEFASWGKFQIMGAWADELGWPSVLDFVYDMTRSESAHFKAFARYVEMAGLKPALRKIDDRAENAVAFASGYNGKGFRKFAYHVKIASAHAAGV